MTDRMHPEDLRALCAASILADPNATVDSAIKCADELLIELSVVAWAEMQRAKLPVEP